MKKFMIRKLFARAKGIAGLSLACLTLTLSGCSDVPQEEDASKTKGTQVSITITPAEAFVIKSGAIGFSASGGDSTSYNFSVISGPGSITTSGIYSPGGQSGLAVISVTDVKGNSTKAKITVYEPVSIAEISGGVAYNATTTLVASGGVPPYTFSVESGGGTVDAASGLFTAPETGSASIVKVVDSKKNKGIRSIALYSSFTVSPAAESLVYSEQSTLTVSGGMSPFTYSILSGGVGTVSDSGVFSAGTTAGTSTVQVTDAGGHTMQATFTVFPSIAMTPTSVTLPAGTTHSFSATGGVPPLAFELVSGSGNINSTTGIYTAPANGGSAVVKVVDAKGHSVSANISIFVPAPITITPSTLHLLTSASQAYTGAGGIPPYLFSIQSGGGSINPSTGVYTAPAAAGAVVIKIQDSIGASAAATVNVFVPLAISPISSSLFVNGLQTFTASGGVSPYTFSITSGGGIIDANSGIYTAPAVSGSTNIRVTDSLGNTANASIIIIDLLTITPAAKTLAVNNTFSFVAVGGFGGNVFSIQSGGGSINSSTGFYTAPAAAGSAVILVTDSQGGTATANVTINAALAISPTSKTMVANATQTFTATGGVAPYTYSLQSGTGSINSTTGVYTAPTTIGSAVVLVTDSLGNSSTSTITINNNLTISPTTAVLVVSNTNTFSAAGGVPPYTFSIQSGGGTINASSGLYTAPLSAGSAVIRVADSAAHTATAAVTINSALTLSPSTFYMYTNGTKNLTASGGVSPYTYSVLSGTGTVDSVTGVFTAGPSADTTVVTVTDSLGNVATATGTITDPLVISSSSTVFVVDSVSSVSATGGSGIYAFSVVSGSGVIDSVSGDFTAPSISETDVLRVTDSLGNTADISVVIYDQIAISPSSQTLVANGNQTFVGSGGYGSLTFSVSQGAGTINSSTGAYIAPSSAGTETVRVTDSLGNFAEATVTVFAGLTISPNTKTLATNRKVTLTAAGGMAPYSFSLISGEGSIDPDTGVYIAPSSAGNAQVQVTDSLNNTSTSTINIISISKVVSNPQATHSCALFSNGGLKCWGNNASGQLGYGNTTSRGTGTTSTTGMGDNLPFVTPILGKMAKDVVVGGSHTCVILQDDTATCWGANTKGQLGQGNNYTYGKTTATTTCNGTSLSCAMSQLAAINFGGQSTIKRIYAGNVHTCAILMDDSTRCFGDNSKGELGINSTTNIGTTAAQMTALAAIGLGSGKFATSLALGDLHTCALLNDGNVRCWGNNANGQLGVDSVVLYGNATTTGATCVGNKACAMSELLNLNPINLGQSAKAIRAGVSMSCAILNDNSAKCWGNNSKGELGQNNTIKYGNSTATSGTSRTITNLTPLTGTSLGMGSGSSIIDLAISYYSSGSASGVCAISDTSKVKCWGGNSTYQAGIATGTSATTIVSIGTTATASSTAATMTSTATGTTSYTNLTNIGTSAVPGSLMGGAGYYCTVINSNSDVKCWGNNAKGQLGMENTTSLGSRGSQMGDGLLILVFAGAR